jgi:hypothetical protein
VLGWLEWEASPTPALNTYHSHVQAQYLELDTVNDEEVARVSANNNAVV